MLEYLQSRYPDVPVQYCQFHQKKTIRRYLTKESKTKCGIELKRLKKDLTYKEKVTFVSGINDMLERYKDFLAEQRVYAPAAQGTSGA